MRLRCVAVDYFHEASRSSREEYLRRALPLPIVTILEERFDALSKLDGVDYSCHRSIFDSCSPKISLELPRDFPWVKDTNTYDKFLSEIFPSKLPRQPSLDPGEGVINRSESVLWLCSGMEQIKLQVLTEDDSRIPYRSQTGDPGEIHEATPKFLVSDKVLHLSCSGQSTLGQHVKEQKPGSFVSEFLSIEPPQLELRDWITQPDWWRIFLGLGGEQLSAVTPNEGVDLPIVDVPKAWFDILPLPYSKERWKNESTAVEVPFNDIYDLRQFEEAYHSRRNPDKMKNLFAKIVPIEIRMIPENVNRQDRGENEMPYPLKPTCLIQWFESKEGTMEKVAHNLPLGGFNTKMTLEDTLTSNLVYSEEHAQPTMLPPSLLSDLCDPQPCSISVMHSATNPFHGIKLKFEIPRTCDWSLSSFANTTPGIIAANESETLVPDLPRLHPLQSFHSAVVIPELSLDDQQFQFLPVPVVTFSQEYMVDAEVGRLMFLNCEPCPVPATDWLYLDWHFFHGLKCTNAVCFSLMAQLIEEARCPPLLSTSLTTEAETLQQGFKFALELTLLEDNGFHPGSRAISRVTGTRGEKIEALHCSLAGEVSQKGCKQSYPSPLEIQRPHGREYKPLLQTHCVDLPTDIDKITENGFLPANCASNLPQINHKSREEDGNVDPEVQATKYNTDPGRIRSSHLQNMQPVERFRNSKTILNEAGHFQRKSKEETPSNDPGSRRDVRSTSAQSGSDFMASDFDFFVRARKGFSVTGSDLQTKDPQKNSSTALSPTPRPDDQDHTTEAVAFCEHEVELSSEIGKCMVSLSSDYFALLAVEEISQLKTPGDLKTLKQFGFDADGNSYLTSLISNLADEPVSRQRQIALRGLIALHVLRHTALNLCNYGIQVSHLYLENCFENMQFLEGYIIGSRTELEEAYDQVERGMAEDHPKLRSLDKLLGPVALEIHRAKYISTRILLLADRRAFFTLVRKLVSLGLAPYQIDRKENYLHNGMLREDSLDKLKDEISEALTFSDCLLVSYAYLNPSFPVQRFNMIIQYADSPYTSTTIRSWTQGRYVVHFFKVLVHPEEFRMKGSSSSSQRQTDCQDLPEHSLSGSTTWFKPKKAVAPSADQSLSERSASEHKRTTRSSSGGATNQITGENCPSERREMIIVANISHPNDHMLTGRRSSYLKILHLEKENLQVVERELRLPVDLILSPASCIVVYTLGKLNLEPHNLKDSQETFQTEVLTHLKAISFSFRDCIMVFEGPTEFTTAALEICTQMYTLAIALDIQFQCFASRHPDVTDSILMHSIQAVRRSKYMPSYPMMTEGPTLAEVFLTGFPSVNPLTAHAILSSGCSLPLFMSYAPEQQYAAVEPYEVPKHCLELFKAQCTFKALVTTAVSDCKGVGVQTNQPDMGIPYKHQADSPAVCLDVPTHATRPEDWRSFPEFPPASAISDDSPTYHVRGINPINSFPDFPPISEISSQVEDPEENEPSSTDFYEAIDIPKQSPAEISTWPLYHSERDNVSPYEGAHVKNKAQEMYAQDDIQWLSKGSGSTEFRSGRFPNGLDDTFQMPLNPRATRCEVLDNPFRLEKRHSPWLTSAPVNGSKRLGGAPENLHGGFESLQDSKQPIPRPQLGVKRDLGSSFPFISPTVYGGRHDMGLYNALGSWNDHKRVRVTNEFMMETFDLQGIDGPRATKLPTGPNGTDEFPPVRPGWIENSPSVHEETNLNPRLRHSKRPQATLKASSFDRFRYQSKIPATASNNYTQTTIKFPTIKFGRTAPRRSRAQSPSGTCLRPTMAGKPTCMKKTFSEFAGERRPRAILGVARRGSDTQQRLVWKTNPSSSCSKRPRIS